MIAGVTLMSDELPATANEERFALALEAIAEGFYDWNVAADTFYGSPRLYATLGLNAEETRTRDDWSRHVHPDDLPRYRDAWRAFFKGATARFECEFRYRDAVGRWRWARTGPHCATRPAASPGWSAASAMSLTRNSANSTRCSSTRRR
jgi:PAS domain-containing protein